MSQEKDDVIVKIMDREFQVKCPTDKVPELHKATKFLDTKIKELKNDYVKILNKDNLIIIAALNIISELFQNRAQHNAYVTNSNSEIQQIQNLIENTLAEDE